MRIKLPTQFLYAPFFLCFVLLGVVTIHSAFSSTSKSDSAAAPQAQPSDHHEKKSGRMCGPNCLAAVAALLGVAADPTDIAAKCHMTEQGTSLLDLKRAAVSLGLKATGRQLTWDELRGLSSPAILFVNMTHFIVTVPSTDDSVRNTPLSAEAGPSISILDPPRVAESYTQARLESAWRGEALVLEREKTFDSEEPHAQFETLLNDFGTVYDNESTSFTYRFRNTGRKPLEILDVKKSCGCTKTKLDKSRLEPGEEAALEVGLKMEGRQGLQRQHAYLKTNDPRQPVITLCYQGFSQKPYRVSTDRIEIPEAIAGQTVRGKAIVTDRGNSMLRIKGTTVTWDSGQKETASIKVSSGFAAISGLKGEVIALTFPARQVKELTDPTEPVQFEVCLAADLPVDLPPAVYSGKMAVMTNDRRQPGFEIPFTIQVTSEITVNPPSVSFGVVSGSEPVERKLTILNHGKRSFDLNAKDVTFHSGDSKHVGLAVRQIENHGTSATLTVAFDPRSISGAGDGELLKGSLNAQIAGMKEIEVPWMCYVKTASKKN